MLHRHTLPQSGVGERVVDIMSANCCRARSFNRARSFSSIYRPVIGSQRTLSSAGPVLLSLTEFTNDCEKRKRKRDVLRFPFEVQQPSLFCQRFFTEKVKIPHRNFSVFKNLSSTLVAGDWHSPSFMEGESAEAKEQWLSSLILNREDHELDSAAHFVVIDGWAQSGANGAAQKAEEWLVTLERHHNDFLHSQNVGTAGNSVSNSRAHNSRLEPTIDCYNSVIFAWARSGESIAVIRAERWLNKVKQAMVDAQSTKANLHDFPTSSVMLGPNTQSYNFFLDCLSKGCSKTQVELRLNAVKADETLREMIEARQNSHGDRVVPDTNSFNFVLRAWTRCRNDVSIVSKVMDVLREMELYQRSSQKPNQSAVKPNTLSYSLAMDAWAVVAGLKAQRNLRMKKGHVTRSESVDGPKEHDFSNGHDEIKKAEAILEYMHALQEAGADVVPNTISYNIILGGYARISNEINSDSPLRAERLLRRMMDFQNEENSCIAPDQRSYSHVIRCWAKIKRQNSGERGEWWLRKMWQEFHDSGNEDIRPNVDVYNAVMSGYGTYDAAKVDELLAEMIDLEQSDSSPFRPNTESYSIAMRSWLQSEGKNGSHDAGGRNIFNAFKRLKDLIEREESGVPGSSTSKEMYCGILKAAAKAAEINENTLDIVVETYEKFQASRHTVDENAYTWLLQTGLRVMSAPHYDRRRIKFIRTLTRACCENGLISKSFVAALANSPTWKEGWTIEASDCLTKEYFGHWPLPLSWSRNIRNKSLLPREIDAKRRHFRIEEIAYRP